MPFKYSFLSSYPLLEVFWMEGAGNFRRVHLQLKHCERGCSEETFVRTYVHTTSTKWLLTSWKYATSNYGYHVSWFHNFRIDCHPLRETLWMKISSGYFPRGRPTYYSPSHSAGLHPAIRSSWRDEWKEKSCKKMKKYENTRDFHS